MGFRRRDIWVCDWCCTEEEVDSPKGGTTPIGWLGLSGDQPIDLQGAPSDTAFCGMSCYEKWIEARRMSDHIAEKVFDTLKAGKDLPVPHEWTHGK